MEEEDEASDDDDADPQSQPRDESSDSLKIVVLSLVGLGLVSFFVPLRLLFSFAIVLPLVKKV